jgi:AraC family transcriptional regulator, regulatory protein of adaptative response / DNA-3-methyladenine glycosylase II
VTSNPDALYAALVSRDPRFDGVFFVGVTSTGIYCRPVCPARTPRAGNCRFFQHAAEAEKASFRPCLRCRPELAPGTAPVDDGHRIASLVAQRIDEGAAGDGANLEQLASRFGWSSRQIRRIVQRELGVSPIELVQTRRLLLAKQLLTETTLPISEVAMASGFASLRRFNGAFSDRYGMPPTRLRKTADSIDRTDAAGSLTLHLTYREPFDWLGLLRFLRARAVPGVEAVTDDAYFRTVRLGKHRGWIHVHQRPERRALVVQLSQALTPVLPALLGRLRHLFDLDARPDVIDAYLGADKRLARVVAANPGLRVPGAFDGFELAVRAILGQQVTVKGATTLAGRFAAALGDTIGTPHHGLTRLAPTVRRVAAADPSDIAAQGIIRKRAEAIVHLAREISEGRLVLEPGGDPDATIGSLTALPGIGSWTAHYIAMRALRWPDAFPKEDIVLRKRLGGATPAEADARSQAWRPWRSYATLHLWQDAGPESIMYTKRSNA